VSQSSTAVDLARPRVAPVDLWIPQQRRNGRRETAQSAVEAVSKEQDPRIAR